MAKFYSIYLNTILVAVYLLSNTNAAPKPKPEQQFIYSNQEQNYDKNFWANFNQNYNNPNEQNNYEANIHQSHGFSFDNPIHNIESHNNQHNYNQHIMNQIEKIRTNRHSNSIPKNDKYPSEYKNPYPKHIKEELIVHRPSPIIVNRKPTKLLINHSPIVVRPAPVIFHRAPQAVRPIIIHNSRPQPPSPALRIQPVFVNVNRKKSNHQKSEYGSSGGNDENWYHHLLNNKKSHHSTLKDIDENEKHYQHRSHGGQYGSEDDIISALSAKSKNIYFNGDEHSNQHHVGSNVYDY